MCKTLLLTRQILVLWLILFVFQIFFYATKAPLVLLILALTSDSELPSFILLVPRPLQWSVLLQSLWDLLFDSCFHSAFVLLAFIFNPIFPAFLARFLLLSWMSPQRCDRRAISYTKSRSSSVSLKVHLMPAFVPNAVSFMTQLIPRRRGTWIICILMFHTCLYFKILPQVLATNDRRCKITIERLDYAHSLVGIP